MNPISTRIGRPVMALMILFGLSACASVDTGGDAAAFDAASRAAPVDSVIAPTSADPAAVPSNFRVVEVNVEVPETLRVSEANRYLPGGDIVWREDPIGNRYEQVATIVKAGLTQGVAELNGSQPVVLDVVVSKFHALTEKARYTVGGVHAIQFTMRLRDADTGAVIGAPKFIKADFDALGGQAAIQAEQKGITQKVRITNHLAFVIEQELGSTQGYAERDTGLIGALNQL
ncbi:MAG: DUF6778 family protein [Pseudomonadota bacterium]